MRKPRVVIAAAVGVLMALALCLGTGSVFAQDDPLVRARKALALSNYGLAEKELASVKNAARNVEARLLEVRLKLWTGRYAEAARVAKQAAKLGSAAKGRLAPWWAEALVRQGKRGQAIRVLRDIKDEPDAHRARLLLGELLIDSGKRTEADEPLMALVHAYNNDEIKDTDPEGLAMVGRAAHLLRAYRDANEAYNKAERVGAKKRVDALLWRADLFLEKYDPGHAAQVVGEAAKLAPKDPRVQVAMARVKLEQAMDFGAAEELVGKALKTDPNLAEAYFVRAGLALRVMDLSAAKAATDAGLKSDPSNLELRSMAAATRFLGEDEAGFKAAKAGVFKLNPTYSQFYLIVGEFAEWEHRYDEIVAMMRQAVKVDPMDAKAHAALGLNLIRNGEDQTGLEQLRKSWKRDKYNVRVFNTLNLYEDTIAKDYTTVEGTVFRIRYHKAERRILERYVPQMLDQAWASMVKRYGFTPKVPVGIELYADSQHFSVRTSGLPNVGIQGVCFGKTLAALSPSAGSFNWGMILWHELGHVFHIQQSHNRVPRWFTEGLAEYETIIQRPEWRREEHLALYLGLRDDKIPKVASFNRAFTHVDSPQDITMAYFAASQILVFLADEFGIDKVVAHLPACGKGMPTPAVVQQVLGISAEELDARFHKWLEPRLSRYRKQFVPDLRPPKSLEEARKALAADPKSAKKHVKLALAMLREGKMQEAQSTLKLALRIDPKEPDALFLQVRLAMQDKELDEADKLVQQLIKNGNDGYAVSMKAADLAEIKKDKEGMGKYLRAAHRHDPSQAEPLQALYDMAKKDKDENGQLGALRQLAKLEQHDRRVFGRLLGLLVKRGYWKEATAVGSSAIYVDVANPKIHWNYARALARTGKHISAIRELNSAILSRPEPKDAVAIYRMMAEGYRKLGKKAYATKADQYAKQMAAIKPQPAPGATPLGQR